MKRFYMSSMFVLLFCTAYPVRAALSTLALITKYLPTTLNRLTPFEQPAVSDDSIAPISMLSSKQIIHALHASCDDKKFPLHDAVNILYRSAFWPGPILYFSDTELQSYNDISDFRKLSKVVVLKKKAYEHAALSPENEITLCQQLHDQRVRKELASNYERVTRKWSVSLEESQQLLEDAKLILKSFLPVTEFDPKKEKEGWIEKRTTLGRLYTYTKLELIIHDKNLSHIHLPKKVLLIENKKAKKFLNNQEASALLDQLMNVAIIFVEYEPLFSPRVEITPLADQDYTFHVYAEKKHNSSVPLSKTAVEELIELVKYAPFDVGDHDRDKNIFTDGNGDAVIIDTELKRDTRNDTLKKLAVRLVPEQLKSEILPKVQEWLDNNKEFPVMECSPNTDAITETLP